VLDLYTGNVYSKASRRLVRTYKRSHLQEMLDKLALVGVFPPTTEGIMVRR
jgi:hypothetical protein